MEVLVTGGAGYVGSALVPILLSEGHHVTVVDTLRRSSRGLADCVDSPSFSFLQADVADSTKMARVTPGFEAVIHLAGVVGSPACDAEPGLARSTNVDGTAALVDSLRDDQLFLFASTGSVYGAVLGECTEATPRNPLTLYAETKAIAEDITLSRPGSIVFRFATAFGASPAMRFDLLPHHLAQTALSDGNIVIFEGSARRTFVHVKDMARAFLHVLSNRSQVPDSVYNVGAQALNVTKSELAAIVAKLTGAVVLDVDNRTDPDRRDYEVNYRNFEATGFGTLVSLEDGLRGVINLARIQAIRY
jgi:nucleoside-diphosphate-sugar epimerase